MSPKREHGPRHDAAQVYEEILVKAALGKPQEVLDFCQLEIVPAYDALCCLTRRAPLSKLTEHFELSRLALSDTLEVAYPKNSGLVLQELAQLISDHISQPNPVQDFVRQEIGALYLYEINKRRAQAEPTILKLLNPDATASDIAGASLDASLPHGIVAPDEELMRDFCLAVSQFLERRGVPSEALDPLVLEALDEIQKIRIDDLCQVYLSFEEPKVQVEELPFEMLETAVSICTEELGGIPSKGEQKVSLEVAREALYGRIKTSISALLALQAVETDDLREVEDTEVWDSLIARLDARRHNEYKRRQDQISHFVDDEEFFRN